jgi:hypothetical protein
MNTIEARKTVEDLEAKLAAASAREIELATEGRRLAFDAETGDAAAKKALAKFDEEAFVIERGRKNLQHALEEARRRLAAVVYAEERALLAGNAERALELAENIAARGLRLDEALAVVAAESKAYAADIAALNQLGCGSPRVEQFTSLGERAVSFALMASPLKIRHLGFNERHTFGELSGTWRDSVARWASAFLDKSEAA